VAQRLLPTGVCWCGCGEETARGSFFLTGHDKVAESAVVLAEYGGVAEFLASHGYSPEGKNPRQVLEVWHEQRKAKRSMSYKKRREQSLSRPGSRMGSDYTS
jgi:hypothetical protein